MGHYHYFMIHDPKERLICAASFPERVLHHALMNICHEYFDRTLIYDTYATRIGKGTYAALERASQGVKCYAYVVKLDVRKYFDSIRHDVLKEKLAKLFKDKTLLAIFDQLIESYHTTDKSGLPIGNLTSQYFANLYLSDIDHYIKERYQIPIYVRYMDDMLLFADSKKRLKRVVEQIQMQMQQIGLTLKPALMLRAEQGVPFLGYRVYPHKILLSGRSKRRFAHNIQLLEQMRIAGKIGEEDYMRHVVPLVEYTRWAYSKTYRNRLYNRALTVCSVAAVGTTTRGTVA